MEQHEDFKSEFKRRMRAQIADALATVNFDGNAIQPGLHLMQTSPVSVSWSDRINTLRRVELMRAIVAGDAHQVDRSAA